MPAILIIDDDPLIRHRLVSDLKELACDLIVAESMQEGMDVVAKQPCDVVLLDVMLPDGSGLDVFRRMRERDARLPVIFITAAEDSETAIEAMKLGAYDYLVKPLDSRQVRELVGRALEIRRQSQTPVELTVRAVPGDKPRDVLIGRCPAMQEVYKAIGRVAPQNVTVLIEGESGTGKELVARALYQHSVRAAGSFLAINCAAIPETLLESELFGHEKGAFTGADRRRIGKFEQCSGGTLFLDEIGDMPLATQSKMLRILQEQRFERVGGTETIGTDVRVLAATNQNLRQRADAGLFRGDLFFRLNGFRIRLPALRERLADLPLLLENFLNRFRRELQKPVQSIAPDALDLLLNYDWPGNVREFQNAIRHALLLSTGSVLRPEFLPDEVRNSVPCASPDAPSAPLLSAWQSLLQRRLNDATTDLYAEVLEAMERELFTTVLEHTRGNKLQAARLLGITRGRLRRRMSELGLDGRDETNGGPFA